MVDSLPTHHDDAIRASAIASLFTKQMATTPASVVRELDHEFMALHRKYGVSESIGSYNVRAQAICVACRKILFKAALG